MKPLPGTDARPLAAGIRMSRSGGGRGGAQDQPERGGPPRAGPPTADLPGLAGWPVRGLAWTRQHPAATDRILTALLAAVSVSSIWLTPWSKSAHDRSPGAGAVLLALATVVPLLARRRRPDLVLVASGTALLAYDALNYPSGLVFLATFWAVYSYACHRRSNSQWPLAVWVAEILAHLGVARQNDPAQTVLAYLAATAFVWVRGDAVRSDLIRAAREKEARALQAVTDERVRIAWELHDVVAHALGVIVMQAGGAGSVPGLAAVGVPLLAILIRIAVEEARLARDLGDDYRSYARRTKRLVPGLW